MAPLPWAIASPLLLGKGSPASTHVAKSVCAFKMKVFEARPRLLDRLAFELQLFDILDAFKLCMRAHVFQFASVLESGVRVRRSAKNGQGQPDGFGARRLACSAMTTGHPAKLPAMVEQSFEPRNNASRELRKRKGVAKASRLSNKWHKKLLVLVKGHPCRKLKDVRSIKVNS